MQMLVAEKTVGLSWVSVRDRLPLDGDVRSYLTQIPMTLEERLGVGFMETGQFTIVHW